MVNNTQLSAVLTQWASSFDDVRHLKIHFPELGHYTSIKFLNGNFTF